MRGISGREVILIAAGALGACASGTAHPNPIPVTQSRSQEPAVTWLLTSFADPAGRGELDTLVVSPDTVELRVGQHIQLGNVLQVVGLTASGDTVGAVIPVMNVERSGNWIAQITEQGLRGLHPGVANVLVTPLLTSPGRAVFTRVAVRVRGR